MNRILCFFLGHKWTFTAQFREPSQFTRHIRNVSDMLTRCECLRCGVKGENLQ